MLIVSRLVLAVFVCALSFGWTSAVAQESPLEAKKSKPQNGSGTVYIFWLDVENRIFPKSMMKRITVRVGGRQMAIIQPGEFVGLNLPAGKQTIVLEEDVILGTSRTPSTVTVSSGARYYQIVSQNAGGWLQEIPSEVARPEMAKLKKR
ncbi:MAG: hypothetical protein SGJ17_04570 [Hyphomicrobiales bacterium]|nr:hypothetical protein [Hyphomicrobiales bacterium]